jgi:hypothetical protein
MAATPAPTLAAAPRGPTDGSSTELKQLLLVVNATRNSLRAMQAQSAKNHKRTMGFLQELVKWASTGKLRKRRALEVGSGPEPPPPPPTAGALALPLALPPRRAPPQVVTGDDPRL